MVPSQMSDKKVLMEYMYGSTTHLPALAKPHLAVPNHQPKLIPPGSVEEACDLPFRFFGLSGASIAPIDHPMTYTLLGGW